MTRLSNGDGRMITVSDSERRLTPKKDGGSGNSMSRQVRMAGKGQGGAISRKIFKEGMRYCVEREEGVVESWVDDRRVCIPRGNVSVIHFLSCGAFVYILTDESIWIVYVCLFSRR